jgi:hypothetical protein
VGRRRRPRRMAIEIGLMIWGDRVKGIGMNKLIF